MKNAKQLLEEGQKIYVEEYTVSTIGYISSDYISGPKFSKWKNDLKIFASQLDDSCPLKKDLLDHNLFRRAYAADMKEVFGVLESLLDDDSCISMPMKSMKEYDVFISHANKDKSDYVDSLYLAIRKLGVNIFYDTEVFLGVIIGNKLFLTGRKNLNLQLS